MHPIIKAASKIMRKLKDEPLQPLQCANCNKDIPLGVVVFVKPANVNKAMDGRETPQYLLCPDCSPARGSVGCYYTLIDNVYDDLKNCPGREPGQGS